MCGIFGVVIGGDKKMDSQKIRSWCDSLFELSDSRGKEASGVAIQTPGEISIYRQPIRGKKLIKHKSYADLFKKKDISAIIGHSRLATNGIQTDNENNQPVYSRNGVIIHNGIVVNYHTLWTRLRLKPKSEVDTEVLLASIEHFAQHRSVLDAVKKTYSIIEGSASIAYLPGLDNSLILATNTGSLYYIVTSTGKLVFASESYILTRFIESFDLGISDDKITNIQPFTGVHVDFKNLGIVKFAFHSKKRKSLLKKRVNSKKVKITEVKEEIIIEPTLTLLSSVNNSLSKIKKHTFDYKKILALKRCAKCILPLTMPYIVFDDDGVCNYCRKYKKVEYKGILKLEEILSRFRSSSKKHDCVVAFSGGRDSAFGLHCLKKQMGMNPIAYTFDWGMVTELARRNQARLVGKLGVEHIIVSPDITYKRNNIRKNILAWLKKPELGMIPLFTVGDKQAEYYVDRVARQNDIKLVIYCSGCEMENDDFKAAYAGVKNAYPGAILHNMSPIGRVKMLKYYLTQFAKNPSYINSSIWDTMFGYFSIYMKPHNYQYLWYFIPWNEQEIVSTLESEYGWETDPNTTLTWRTDDATPAFYNYIYYQVQGFTENDAFRSNQIREGVMTRSMALKLVNEENKPRPDALKWYFDVLGLDGDKVLNAVDDMPKIY